jgi:abortive infection bacteriophage resistance protein
VLVKQFEKPAKTIDELINLCEKRGLNVDNQEKTRRFFQYAGYYRLSGYMLPFQKKKHGGDTHDFVDGTTLDKIINLYIFDRKLRLLVMDAIERIEVAIRAVLSDTMSLAHDPHWFMNASNFKESFNHKNFMEKVDEAVKEIGRHQTFINHYNSTYNDPIYPPSWMLFEILHFGTVSKIYSALPLPHQKEIAGQFGVHYRILTSWLHTISSLRNICAHHARLWNRVFGISPRSVKALQEHFDHNDRFYAQVVTIKVLLDKITGHSLWAQKLKDLFDEYPDVPKAPMGFPENWTKSDLWFGD